MTLQELIERRAQFRAQLINLNNRGQSLQGRAKGRELSEHEQRQADEIFAQFDVIETQITELDREIENAQLEDNATRPPGRQIPAMRPADASAFVGSAAAQRRPSSGRELFPAHDPYAHRFESFADFALAVAAGAQDSRLITNSAMSEGTGTSGGYLVPSTWASRLFEDALQLELIRPRCRVVSMPTPQMMVPVFDGEDATGSARGGLTLKWMSEASTATDQAGKTREVNLIAKKAAVFVRVSSEAASDIPSFDAQLSSAMSQAIAAGLDAAFVGGTGAGQPLGLLNSGAKIEVAKVSTQATNSLVLKNLADAVGSLTPQSFRTAIWAVHPTVVPSLINMGYVVMNVGATETTGGSFVQAVTFEQDGNFRIFGKECVISDACSVLGAPGDVILFDPQRYLVGVRREMSLERDIGPYCSTDELAFRMMVRLDGQCLNLKPVKLANGSTTVAPIVTIASRA